MSYTHHIILSFYHAFKILQQKVLSVHFRIWKKRDWGLPVLLIVDNGLAGE